MRVLFLNRRLYLPAVLWFGLAACVLLLCFLQETRLVRLVPFLAPDTAYGALLLLLAAYLLLVWPFSLARMLPVHRHRPWGALRFHGNALSAPLLLFLLLYPLLAAAAHYSARDPGHALALGLGLLAPAAAVLAYFRLSFFFAFRPLRHYLVAAALLIAGVPLLDLVLSVAYGRGSGAFLGLSPLHFVLMGLSETDLLSRQPFWNFAAAWAGLALALACLPLAAGRPAFRAYEHMAFHSDEAV